MRFGGVDPSIIRELSGIYKPFPKAFRELVSNAFDADARAIDIRFSREAKSISIADDGVGMTPFDFHRDFTKIGGSEKARSGAMTALGRPRIGCKGIGFLAVARYCSRMVVETYCPRVQRLRVALTQSKAEVRVADALVIQIPDSHLAGRTSLAKVRSEESQKDLREGKDYTFDRTTTTVRFLGAERRKLSRRLVAELSIDCKGLGLTAVLDFNALLQLAHGTDLYELDTFCTTAFQAVDATKGYTRITLQELHDDVLEDLTREARGTNIKSVELKSGREQFQWHLERMVPLAYPRTPWTEKSDLIKLQEEGRLHYLPDIRLHWDREEPRSLSRRVYASGAEDLAGTAHSVIPINIQENGLEARGYVLATSEVISPAEYRGITVRVRNVAIGDPHFFGLERTLTGAQRAALQQITGELVVLKGLDTADALNPGRESFYEENREAKRLREIMAGKPPVLGGVIKRAVQRVLEHSQLSGRARTYLALAQRRRKALLECAGAINRYCYEGYGEVFSKFFASTSSGRLNLKDAPTVPLRPPTRLHDYSIQHRDGLKTDYAIDQSSKLVLFDYSQEVWDTQLFIAGNHFTVEAKRGTTKDPLCEIDPVNRRIYVNWSHPLKQSADEAQYLKIAILWTLAFELFERPKQVMELGLALLTHSEA